MNRLNLEHGLCLSFSLTLSVFVCFDILYVLPVLSCQAKGKLRFPRYPSRTKSTGLFALIGKAAIHLPNTHGGNMHILVTSPNPKIASATYHIRNPTDLDKIIKIQQIKFATCPDPYAVAQIYISTSVNNKWVGSINIYIGAKHNTNTLDLYNQLIHLHKTPTKQKPTLTLVKTIRPAKQQTLPTQHNQSTNNSASNGESL